MAAASSNVLGGSANAFNTNVSNSTALSSVLDSNLTSGLGSNVATSSSGNTTFQGDGSGLGTLGCFFLFFW